MALVLLKDLFGDLDVGDEFEFDHTGVSFGFGLAKGPWVKTSPRKYRRADQPRGPFHTVGTVNVKVVPASTVAPGPTVTRVKSAGLYAFGPARTNREGLSFSEWCDAAGWGTAARKNGWSGHGNEEPELAWQMGEDPTAHRAEQRAGAQGLRRGLGLMAVHGVEVSKTALVVGGFGLAAVAAVATYALWPKASVAHAPPPVIVPPPVQAAPAPAGSSGAAQAAQVVGQVGQALGGLFGGSGGSGGSSLGGLASSLGASG